MTEQLAMSLEQVRDLLERRHTGVIREVGDGRSAVEPAVVAALVQQNRTRLLAAAA